MYIVSTQRKIITLLFIAPLWRSETPALFRRRSAADDGVWSVLYWCRAPTMTRSCRLSKKLIISDRWAGNISFYPRAWSSDRLHLCIISASPAININHDQWWGEHIQIRHNPRAHIQSDHHHHQVWAMMWGLSSYPGTVIRCWLLILNTRSPSRHQPVFTALPCATHNGTQNLHKIALQNLCIKLTDV